MYGADTKAPALGKRVTDALSSTVRDCHYQMQRYHPLFLSRQELVELFVKPEHIEHFEWAAENLPSGQHWLRSKWVAVTEQFGPRNVFVNFGFNNMGSMPLPRYAGSGPVTFSGEPAHRVAEWLNGWANRAYDWMIVREVIKELNWRCSRPEQMTALMPSLMTLLKMNSEADALAKRIERAGTPRGIPYIPTPLLQAVHRANTTITVFKLMREAEIPDNPTGPYVSVGGTEVPGVFMPWAPEESGKIVDNF